MGFNMLSMANNHAWDLGLNGLLAGIGEVSKRGFAYAGTGADVDAAAAIPAAALKKRRRDKDDMRSLLGVWRARGCPHWTMVVSRPAELT